MCCDDGLVDVGLSVVDVANEHNLIGWDVVHNFRDPCHEMEKK